MFYHYVADIKFIRMDLNIVKGPCIYLSIYLKFNPFKCNKQRQSNVEWMPFFLIFLKLWLNICLYIVNTSKIYTGNNIKYPKYTDDVVRNKKSIFYLRIFFCLFHYLSPNTFHCLITFAFNWKLSYDIFRGKYGL